MTTDHEKAPDFRDAQPLPFFPFLTGLPGANEEPPKADLEEQEEQP